MNSEDPQLIHDLGTPSSVKLDGAAVRYQRYEVDLRRVIYCSAVLNGYPSHDGRNEREGFKWLKDVEYIYHPGIQGRQ
jgi:hypothetical protein